MAKYDGFMLLTDLDGTFTSVNPDGSTKAYVSDENCEAVHEFMAQGGIFTYATGRRPDYIKEYLFPYVKPNAPMIIANGAAIYDFEADRTIKEFLLPEETLKAPYLAYEECRNLLDEVYMVARDEEFFLDFDDENYLSKWEDIRKNVKNWYKFVFKGKDAEKTLLFKKYLEEKYSDICSLPRSWETGQELLFIKATKGECAKILKNMYKGVHTLICVGDYENDTSMIEVAEKGYAVENALESVKNSADFVTVSNNESAIAKIIAEI